jgi:thioredoxin 1
VEPSYRSGAELGTTGASLLGVVNIFQTKTKEVQAMAGNALAINDSNFESEVLKSDKAVFVDFWAPWCGPCRAIAPFVEQLADDFAGKAKVAKINVDEAQQTAMNFGVMSIPTLMVFKNGNVVETVVGGVGKDEMARMLNKHL